jgi:hypothetical protein
MQILSSIHSRRKIKRRQEMIITLEEHFHPSRRKISVITLICTKHAYLASGHLIFLLFQATTKQLF